MEDSGETYSIRQTLRLEIPKLFKDRIAVLSILAGVPVVVVFEFLCVFPYRYPVYDAGSFWGHFVLVLFLVSNFIGNLLGIMLVEASGKRYQLPHVLRPGWKFCHLCQVNSPPRAYHCWVCRTCILKRDHHCTFAGSCIGFHNHRYYLMAVIYGLICSAYAIYFHWFYIWQELGGFSVFRLWMLFLPQFALLLRFLTFFQFFVSCLQMSMLLGFGFCLYSVTSQFLTNIMRGLTMVEYANGFTEFAYYYSWGSNVKDILGSRYYLVWLCPLIKSPLSGDGLRFHLKQSVAESTKNL